MLLEILKRSSHVPLWQNSFKCQQPAIRELLPTLIPFTTPEETKCCSFISSVNIRVHGLPWEEGAAAASAQHHPLNQQGSVCFSPQTSCSITFLYETELSTCWTRPLNQYSEICRISFNFELWLMSLKEHLRKFHGTESYVYFYLLNGWNQ